MGFAHTVGRLQHASVSLAMVNMPSRYSGQETHQLREEGTPMFRTIRSILAVALAVLFVASAVALAADETMLGTIQKMDVQKGRITLQSTEGKSVELQAPAALLAGLETGDAVEVKITGQKATMIHRLEGAQQTDMGDKMPKQRPGGMRQSE